MSLSRPLRLFLLLLPLLGGLLLSMDWAGRQARQQALRAEGEQVRKQLDLYAGSLQTLIERFRSLPAVLALDPDLRAALAAWKELDLAKAEGFAGTVSYSKALTLLTGAKTQQQFEAYEGCTSKAEKARFYIRESRAGR